MALVLETLQKNMKDFYDSVYEKAKNGIVTSDKDLGEQTFAIIARWAEGGDVAAAVAGTVSAGAYVGNATKKSIKMSEDAANNAYLPLAGTRDEPGDFAFAMATGICTLLAEAEIKLDVIGAATPPSGTPVVLNGEATMSLAVLLASIPAVTIAINAFQTLSTQKTKMWADKDMKVKNPLFDPDYDAQGELVKTIGTVIKTLMVIPGTITGTGALKGAVGIGVIA